MRTHPDSPMRGHRHDLDGPVGQETLRLLPLGATALLGGCNWVVLDPKGQISADERSIIMTAIWLMLIIVVPVIILIFAFAWKYRASNTRAQFTPDWDHSNKIVAVVALAPCVIVLILSVMTWKESHKLDPYRPLESTVPPINVNVVALDWPVMGWVAATGRVGVEPVILFLIIFLWTPPHFWALSLNRAGEYARAGIPMLPVMAGRAETKRQILIYSVLLLPVSVLPWALGFAGAIWRDRGHLRSNDDSARAAATEQWGRKAPCSSPVRVFDSLSVRTVCFAVDGRGDGRPA